MTDSRKISTKKMICIAMMSAIAIVVYYLDFPVPLMPSFIKLDLPMWCRFLQDSPLDLRQE